MCPLVDCNKMKTNSRKATLKFSKSKISFGLEQRLTYQLFSTYV